MDYLELENGTVRELRVIAQFLDESGARCHLDERTLYHVKLVVDEACANVFEHAYAGRAGRVRLEIDCSATLLTVRLFDWGDPFDPTNFRPPDPTLPLDERPIGGLGLHFIHALMDEVEYRFDAARGNCLTLRKRLAGAR